MTVHKKAVIRTTVAVGALLLCGAAAVTAYCLRVTEIPYTEDEEFLSRYTYQNNPQMQVGDPYLFTADGHYYFTGTNDGISFDLRVSEDLKTWKSAGKIFSRDSAGAWGRVNYWQPQILRGPDEKYYLYYSAGWEKNGISRIGVAVSDRVTGPYQEVHGAPMFDPGYSVIDPHVFIDDDGQIYLYFSRALEENVIGGIKTSEIYGVRMKSMTEVEDSPDYIRLTTPKQTWETESGSPRWNEGPDMLKHDGLYYLFYSANCYADRNYAVGYATSDSPLGPFEKAKDNPALSTPQTLISGSGNNSFFYTLDGRELLTAYHVHRDPTRKGSGRVLYIDRCGWREDGSFYFNGPTRSPQPLVSGDAALVRVTGAATIRASSSQEGTTPENAFNGQIGIHTRLAKYEWAAEKNDTAPYWELRFEQPQKADALFLYASTAGSRRPATYTVVVNGRFRYTGVPSGETPGEAAILSLDRIDKVKTLRIEAEDMGDADCMGLSDVQLFYIDGQTDAALP